MIDCNKCTTENCIFNTLVPKENCELYREEDTTTDCTDCKARIRVEVIDECIEAMQKMFEYNDNKGLPHYALYTQISLTSVRNTLEQLKEKK